MRTIHYGPAHGQEGDLHLPAVGRAPVVCLLHGGFWRMPWGRDQMDDLAAAMIARGFAVWNVGYRRAGAPGGGWPATLDDVALALGHLARLADDGIDVNTDDVIVIGHSAGGQLALWAAAQRLPVRIKLVVALAPVTDLVAAQGACIGGDAVTMLIGGSPATFPERYAAASPIARLPLGVRQLVLHGTADDAVPVAQSRRYAQAAREAGDDVELVELEGTGHMEFLERTTAPFALVCHRVQATRDRR